MAKISKIKYVPLGEIISNSSSTVKVDELQMMLSYTKLGVLKLGKIERTLTTVRVSIRAQNVIKQCFIVNKEVRDRGQKTLRLFFPSGLD